MNKLFLFFVFLMLGYSLQAQSTQELQRLCQTSKAQWEIVKKKCNNTYSYTLQKAFYMGNSWKELTIEVVDGEISKTTLKEFKNNKLDKTSTEKLTTFAGLPVGTLDDIYAKAAAVLSAPKSDIEKVYFSTGKDNLISGVAWQNTGLPVKMDMPLPGYNVKAIKYSK